MVDVPAAEVLIGLDPERVDSVTRRWADVGVERDWIVKETPRHKVALASFRIGRYPVTNGEWLAYVTDVADAPRPTAWPHGCFPLAASNQPVFTLAPEDADGYAAWLAARTGRPFRLPTEAEWEYAAAGVEGREFPWGDRWDPHCANTAEAGPLTTTPVGIYVEGRSPFGVADLAGTSRSTSATTTVRTPAQPAVRDDLVGVHGSRLPGGSGRQLRPPRRPGSLRPAARLVPVAALCNGVPARRVGLGTPSVTLTGGSTWNVRRPSRSSAEVPRG